MPILHPITTYIAIGSLFDESLGVSVFVSVGKMVVRTCVVVVTSAVDDGLIKYSME